jgi:hypothetical protein
MEYNYLATSDYIDWQQPIILKQAQLLARNQANLLDVAQTCFNMIGCCQSI